MMSKGEKINHYFLLFHANDYNSPKKKATDLFHQNLFFIFHKIYKYFSKNNKKKKIKNKSKNQNEILQILRYCFHHFTINVMFDFRGIKFTSVSYRIFCLRSYF